MSDTPMLVDPSLKQTVEAEEKTALATQDAILSAPPVTNRQVLEQYSAVYLEIHDKLKKMNEQRLGATRKLKELTDLVNGWFKPTTEALDAAKAALATKIAAFLETQHSKREQLLALMPSAHGRPDVQQQIVAGAAEAHIESLPGLSIREKITFEVTDPTQVPKAFWVLDKAKIEDALMDKVVVPGVTVTRHKYVQPTGKKP